MEELMEERAASKMKYLNLCQPIYKERGNVVAGSLDDDIDRIHQKRGVKKEDER